MKTFFVLFKKQRLEHRQVEAFRKELNVYTANRYDLLHNHSPDSTFIYRYPRVQFRSYKGYAALYGIAEGAELIWNLLGSGELGKNFSSGYEIIQNEDFPAGVGDTLHTYSVKSVYPFNAQNYFVYRHLGSLAEKASFMELKMGTHLVKFCNEFGIAFNKGDIQVNLIDMHKHPGPEIKDEKMLVFDLVMKTNLVLPDFMGLGRFKSHGAGVIKKMS